MVGQIHTRTHWRGACAALAEMYGFDEREIVGMFRSMVADRILWSVADLPRDVHEDSAWRDLKAALLKPGAQGD
jgi:hypothetical protein